VTERRTDHLHGGLGRPQADAIAPHYPIKRPPFFEVAPPDRVVALDQDVEAL
jgi:hypothetical protein